MKKENVKVRCPKCRGEMNRGSPVCYSCKQVVTTKIPFIVAIMVLVILCFAALVLGAQPVSKYWQDVIRKPNQTWQSQYSNNMPQVTNLIVAIQDVFDTMAKNDSDLAFNIRSILEIQTRLAQEVVTLNAIVKTLTDPEYEGKELNDPNELK